MEITFNLVEGIQIITISGALDQAEGAAVRNKLEQKINQGRDKVLLDITSYSLEDNTARSHILNILSYSINRGVLTVCCGAPPTLWPLLIIEGNTQAQAFLSQSEALDFLRKNEPSQPPSLPKTPAEKTDKEVEEEIKSQALQNLLKQYAVFQQTDMDDPFRLAFFAEQYKIDPRGEALAAEKKATDALFKIRDEIPLLENECASLAGRTKQASVFRKHPASDKELQLKTETLIQNLNELKSQHTSAGILLETLEQEAEKAQSEFNNIKMVLETELDTLQKKLETITQEYAEKETKLKEQDVREQKR